MEERPVQYRDDKIRAVQAAKRMTNQQLAVAAGVGLGAVSLVTNGQWDGKVSTLKKITDALGITLQEVFEPRGEVA